MNKYVFLMLNVAASLSIFGSNNLLAEEGAAAAKGAPAQVPVVGTPNGIDLLKALAQATPASGLPTQDLFSQRLMEACKNDPKCSAGLKTPGNDGK